MKADNGVQFPLEDGRRSSQRAGRAIYAAAARFVAPDLAETIERERQWRKRYLGPVAALVEAGCSSPKAALRIAQDGLAELHSRLVFERDGDSLSVGEAFGVFRSEAFESYTVTGTGRRATELSIPYKGKDLCGRDLLEQLERWVANGSLEPSAAAALTSVVEHPEWLDLEDTTVALLGATAEMGPLEKLCSWGATVLAVDLPHSALWQRIFTIARNGAGRVIAPVRRDAGGPPEADAGADLLLDAPEIRTWIGTFEGPVTVGNYAYADGEAFLRLACATDLITASLLAERDDVTIAYLATPTDVFAVPPDVVAAAHAQRRMSGRVAAAISRNKAFAPNYSKTVQGDDRTWGIYDCLVPQQGANYALAKSLQRWRATSAREEGVRTSANVAPATNTLSVTKNPVLRAAYAGAPLFGVEVFAPETSRALMAALLVRDLRDPAAPADPSVPLAHPYDLFIDAAVHGNLWRNPNAPRSVLPLAVVAGLARRKKSA